jgi:uncharacterized membrane protein
MERIEKSVEVKCPVRTVCNQWTQFEEFPRFMAEIWGKDKEWDSEITEQVPDQKIAWRSISGDAPNAGEVRFEPVGPDRTRVKLTLEYEPQGRRPAQALGVQPGMPRAGIYFNSCSLNSTPFDDSSRRATATGNLKRLGPALPGFT